MKRKRILLAVDTASFLPLNDLFSSEDRYTVRTTSDCDEALHLLSVERPDLAIIDAELPGVVDHACNSAIAGSIVPLVMLGRPEHRTALARCRAPGCDTFLEKPFSAQTAAPVVNRLLYGERRREPRIRVRLPVSYGLDAPGPFTDSTADLSAGGLFLESHKALPIDTPLCIGISLPHPGTTINCRARVAWLNGPILRTAPALPPGMGLQLLSLDADQEHAIRSFLTTETLRMRLQ